ncbi:hypothetical protein D3C73_103530 [compost metagenome]
MSPDNQQPEAPAPAPQPAQPAQQVVVAPPRPNGFAVTALVLGIVGFLLGWTGVIGLIIGVLALVFGILAIIKHQNKGMGVTGVVLGGLTVAFALLWMFVIAALISGAGTAINQAAEDAKNREANQAVIYDKISNGMTKAEVEAATGHESGNCVVSEIEGLPKSETCNYGDAIKDGIISVTYSDDKVTAKTKI